MGLLTRVHDSNVYVLDRPSHDRGPFVVGMIHPFDLEGDGHLTRVFRLLPDRVTLSPAAEQATHTGWGVDDISITASGQVTLSHDDDLWIQIELSLPCEVDVKSLTLEEHPEQEGSACYAALRDLEANADIAWETTAVVRCEAHNS